MTLERGQGRLIIKKKNLNIKKTKIMASGSNTSWQIVGETMETVEASESLQMVSATMKLKDTCFLEEKL